MIPQANPSAFVRAHRAEIDTAIARVLDSGRYIGGPEVEAFEGEFAAYLGVRHAVGVASGTEALFLGLWALGVGPGDEVVTTALTAVATVAAIQQTGAAPVFADVRDSDLTLDPDSVAAAITPRARVILPVHLYGQPADLPALSDLAARRRLILFEDCAQSHGARTAGRMTGTWGVIAAFSFYPTKNLGALGDGGMVVSDDPALARRVRLLREYGWRERYVSDVHGWNSRLDPLQAAILRLRLKHLEADNARRREIAARYTQALGHIVRTPPNSDSHAVFHQYVIRHPERDRLREALAARGIGAAIHYPVPVHQQPGYRHLARRLPVTERACGEILSLPIYPELTDEEVDRVIEAIGEYR